MYLIQSSILLIFSFICLARCEDVSNLLDKLSEDLKQEITKDKREKPYWLSGFQGKRSDVNPYLSGYDNHAVLAGFGKREADNPYMMSGAFGKRNIDNPYMMSGAFGKRNYENPAFGFGKRAENPAFGFGKRAENPAFGFGKRAVLENPAFGFGKRAENPAFGFGKRAENPAFGFGKRAENPAFGFGKRAENPAFGFGKRAENPIFGFGKRAENSYLNDALARRENQAWFGALGKRSNANPWMGAFGKRSTDEHPWIFGHKKNLIEAGAAKKKEAARKDASKEKTA